MLNFGFIGIGQCGGKITDCFAKINYQTLAFNTSEKDLNGLVNVPPENRVKIKASGTKGGAGKDPSVGATGMAENIDMVSQRIKDTMTDVDFLFLCAGMGGGTGSGATPVLLNKLLENEEYRVGLILTMPDISEGVEVKGNAIQALISIYQMVSAYEIPMMVIDNDKIVTKMKATPNFDWRTVNDIIARTFNQFNLASNKTSPYVTFDEADYTKTISRPGVFALSKTTFDIADMLNDQVLRERVMHNWEKDLFTVDVNYQQAQMMVTIVEAPSEFLKDRGNYKLLESSLANLRSQLGVTSRYEGIYPVGQIGTKYTRIVVYTLLSGMPAPMEKVKAIYEVAQQEEQEMANKIQNTQNSFDISGFKGVGNVFGKTKPKQSPNNLITLKPVGNNDDDFIHKILK